MREKSYYLICLILLITLCCGCAREEPKEIKILPPQILPEPLKEKPTIPHYTYRNAYSRDPFIPLIVSRGEKKEKKEKIPSVDIRELVLVGVVWDKKGSIALVQDSKGNTFILKHNRLYYGEYPIRGVSGKIISDKCIFLSQADKVVTIGFHPADRKIKIRGVNIPQRTS